MTNGTATATLSSPSAFEPGEVVAVPLRRHDGSVRAVAYVDPDIADLIEEKGWKFHAAENTRGYTYARRWDRSTGKRRAVGLHRDVLELDPDDPREVDHINHDTLDNRRSNLRVATRAQNLQNQRSSGRGSQHRGVSRDGNGWQAHAQVNGRNRKLGYFKTEAEAAQAVSAFRAEHMPYSEDARKETK